MKRIWGAFSFLFMAGMTFAAEADISFRITDDAGYRGQQVSSDVLISTDTDLQGWSWGIRYDGDVLSIVDAQNGALLNTAKNGDPADFKELLIEDPDAIGPGVTQGVVIDIMTVIQLPPGTDYNTATLTFEVLTEPPPAETLLVFADDVGEPDIATVAVVGGLSVVPDPATPGTITILPPPLDCQITLSCGEPDPDNAYLSFSYSAECDKERPFEFIFLYRKKSTETEWQRLMVWDIEDLVEFPTSYDDLGLEPGIYDYMVAWVYWPALGGPLEIGTSSCRAEIIAVLIEDISPDIAFLPGVVKDPVAGLVPAEIVVTGRGFTTVEDTLLTIGDTEVEVTEVTGDSEIRGLVPCSSVLGTFDLKLVNSRGEVEVPDAFTYGWMRADVRIDGVLDLQDALDVLGYLFNIEGSSEPLCLDAADLNSDGFLDITDAIFMVYFLAGVDPGVYTPGEPFQNPKPQPGPLGCALAGFDCENPNP